MVYVSFHKVQCKSNSNEAMWYVYVHPNLNFILDTFIHFYSFLIWRFKNSGKYCGHLALVRVSFLKFNLNCSFTFERLSTYFWLVRGWRVKQPKFFLRTNFQSRNVRLSNFFVFSPVAFKLKLFSFWVFILFIRRMQRKTIVEILRAVMATNAKNLNVVTGLLHF